jgi:uncharacterized protein YbjT (DUF2867 family)
MSDSNRGRVILVTGATGKQGGATARHLLDRGYAVRALTRDPGSESAGELKRIGAEVVQGDLDDRGSVERALGGVYGVYSVQNFWETGFEREVEQGIALADAARQAGVQHFVYSSVGSAHRDTGLSHFESKWKIENHILDLDLPYTIFRPVWFMENWEGFRSWILGGNLALPLDPGVNFQQVAVDDVGAFAAHAFENPRHWLGRSVDLAGDERTVAEIAETFSRVIGRKVEYQQVGWEDYLETAGQEYHDMFRWFQDVGYDANIASLRGEGPKLTSFEEYLRGHGWEGAEAAPG